MCKGHRLSVYDTADLLEIHTKIRKKERGNDVSNRDVSRLGEKHVYGPRNSRAENTCNGENATRGKITCQNKSC